MTDAGPIRRAVGRAYRTVLGVRLVEALLLGIAAVLGLGCALVIEGVRERGVDVAILSSVAFAAAAGSWFAAHRTSRSTLALAADRDLHWGGALSTAYEVEGRARASAVESLLLDRVRHELRPRSIRTAVAPNSVPIIAVPFLAVALFGSVRTGGESEVSEVPELVRRAAGELEGAGGATAEMDEDLRRDWGRAQAQARLMAEQLQRGADPDLVAEGFDDLERSLRELASELRPESELARDVARARENLEAARLGQELGESDGAAPPGRGTAEGGLDGEGSAAGSGALSPGTEAGRPRDTWNPDPAPERVERAAGAGRWWPERHDAVVRGWTELSRTRSGG